jgi:hypothetical protein
MATRGGGGVLAWGLTGGGSEVGE